MGIFQFLTLTLLWFGFLVGPAASSSSSTRRRCWTTSSTADVADGALGLCLCQVPRGARDLQAVDRGQHHGALQGGFLRPRGAGRETAEPGPDDVQAAEDLRGVQRGRPRHQPDDLRPRLVILTAPPGF